MGCAGSKNTKVVKFQEPKTKETTSSSVASSATKDKPAAANNVAGTNNNAADTKKVELTPVQEIPKSEPPPLQVSSKAIEEKAEPVVAETKQEKSSDVLPNVAEGVKASESKRNRKKEPILNGEFDTRETVIDPKTSRIYSPTKLASAPQTLKILHFNDVYNIEPRDQEPVGGAARFVTKINSFEGEPMVLFSGDLLNPSLSK